ncbi:YveK family protein [Rufibacter radiotolerans]|uniref:hypothetical protein n=1 Tax=Rufibacter radiotolerans TaxID=1379910 RepID=UPI0006646290|nr:hypothetical protein [Rufibacter radiotolerans]
MPETKSTDEIDLRDVWRKLKSLFSGLFEFIAGIFRLLLKKWAYFLAITSLGAALAYGVYLYTRPYYGYSMTVLLSDIRNDLIKDLVGNLSLMVNEKNHKELAKQLQVSLEDAEKMKSIQYRDLDQEEVAEDSVLVSAPFAVDVELYSKSIQNTVEAGILHYLETNQYFAKQKQIKKEHLESLVAKLKKDIASIDSTKEVAASLRGPANGFVYGEPLDPTDLYKESVVMYERLTFLEANLKRLENFDVISGFAPKLGPTGPNLKKYLLIGALSSFLLGLVFALYRERKSASVSNARF